MEAAFSGFGRPLRNPVREVPGDASPIVVKPLG
jgi:hypothetical protein